jgi:hypothetical protein
MCGGGGGGSYEAAKVDPTPTTVTGVTDVSSASDRTATEQQRRKRGYRSNAVSTDRGTILGSVTDSLNGYRKTLG